MSRSIGTGFARLAATAAIAVFPAAGLAQTSAPSAPPPGAKYVALGSSFASGPGVTTSADTPSTRCSRSRDNYAHQIARRHSLNLVDVSCSGATTAHLLGPWNELPPQLDAVSPDTRLVTITVGGNDVRYTAGLFAMSCRSAAEAPDAGAPQAQCAPAPPQPTAKDWADLEGRMRQMADEVHRRAPAARLVFVDYTTVLPAQGTCAALSLTPAQADASREINRRVVEITARTARATGSDLVTASAITAGHDACSAEPWANGHSASAASGGAPFHPRLAAHTAIADALDRLLWR